MKPLHRRLATAALGLALVAGCGHAAGTRGAADERDAEAQAGVTTEAVVGATEIRRRPGTAHAGTIDLVALSRDGSAALTRDTVGGVRLWPALDGSVEPIAIGVRGADALSVEPTDGGWLVFAVDPSRGGKLLFVDADAKSTERAALAPFEPLFEGVVLPGGAHVAVLYRDHSIALLDAHGKEVTRYGERRFRPRHLRVSADGQRLLGVVADTGRARLQLQPLRVQLEGAPRIERAGKPRTLSTTAAMTSATTSMSVDGKWFAALDKSTDAGWQVVVVPLDTDGAVRRFEVQMPPHLQPSLGFVDDARLLVSTNDGSLSWSIDVLRKTMHPRTAPPTDHNTQGRAQAFAKNRQVASYGSWLFVHDTDSRAHRFLGYRATQALSVAVSASGAYVAWGYAQGPVYVESLAEDVPRTTVLPTEPQHAPMKVRFVDDDLLLVADTVGELVLYDWRAQTIIDRAGLPGSVRNVDFEPATGLLLVDRHTNDLRVYEVSAKGFGSPHIVADRAYRSGLLGPAAPGDAVLWTLDSGNRLRHYTLKELRSDLSREALENKGTPVPPDQAAPMALDRSGRAYGVRYNGKGMEMFVHGPTLSAGASASASAPSPVANVPARDVTLIVPAPTGDRFVATTGRGDAIALRAYDAQSMRELWSVAQGNGAHEVVWSPDGRFVAIAASTGAMVLDAASGKPVRRRCGLDFVSTGAPPVTAFNAGNRPSICE